MFSVIASFFAAATAGGKAQQQHGGASPASEQARQTGRPGERAKQAAKLILLAQRLSRRWRRRIFHGCCCCCLCCLLFWSFDYQCFFLWVFWKLSLREFVSKFSVRVLLLLWLKLSPTLRTVLFWRFEQCLREVQKITPRLGLGPVCQLVR